VTEDGTECSFRGTYLEVEPPTRTVETWLFEGWPDAEATSVESMDLKEANGVTLLTYRRVFRDKAGRDHMTKFDGHEDHFDNMEDLLRSLLDPKPVRPGRSVASAWGGSSSPRNGGLLHIRVAQ
jgi:uncharacterized protein YndB with AHSA1/START domain